MGAFFLPLPSFVELLLVVWAVVSLIVDAAVDVDGLFALLNGHRRSCCLLREANFAIVEEVVRSIIRYYCIV